MLFSNLRFIFIIYQKHPATDTMGSDNITLKRLGMGVNHGVGGAAAE